MHKPFLLAVALAGLAVFAGRAPAQDLSVFADQSFQAVLEEIVPVFTAQTGFEVQLSLGHSTVLGERIRSGIPADLFFPANEEAMRLMVEKGLVDVSLKRVILLMPPAAPVEEGVEPEAQRVAAAVLNNAQQRLQAMAFLEFLASEPARAAFTRQGFTPP